MTSKQTGQDKVRQALEAGEALTALDALHRFAVFRLAAVVHELRRRGLAIDVQAVRTATGKRIARYRLAGKATHPRLLGPLLGRGTAGRKAPRLSICECPKNFISVSES